MKRTAAMSAAAVALLLVLTAAAYYSFPELFKEPLLSANRSLSGLSEKQAQVGTHRVHYLEGGAGMQRETVVLLHGIFAEKDHWVDFARPLQDRYHVLAPDLPGFGESDRLRGESYGYAEQVERLKDWLGALGVARVHLAGNSMGGTIAALFALKYPERVASVALIGAPHGLRSARPSDMDRLIDAGTTPLIAHNEKEFEQLMRFVFARQPFLPYPILHASQADAIRNASSNEQIWQKQLQDRFLLQQHIDKLRVPTLALWGERDRVFDVSGAETLRARLPDAEVQILAGLGHLPMMEAPAATAERYRQFLVRLSSSPRSR